MKKAKKVLLLALCAVLLVGATIAGTVAYLTSRAEVENTFTVGKVELTMDEAPVNEYGEVVEGDRCSENDYLLVPGGKYVKDPIVHVTASSESCYVFVEITNNIASYIDVGALESQLVANGWTKLEAGVWWQLYTKGGDADLEVFEDFTVLDKADDVAGWDTLEAKLNIVAYAVQFETFANAKAAWDATFGA